MLRIVHEVLGRPDIGMDDDLFDKGATSLSFVRVLAQIKQELRAAVDVTALGGVATPANLAAHADGQSVPAGRANGGTGRTYSQKESVT